MGPVCVEKSEIDFRSYRYLDLDNGMKIMLISSLKPNETPTDYTESDTDPDDEMDQDEEDDEHIENNERKSAAALSIKIGSFSDPIEAQGLAHFLEHMVFMGSTKYPRENDFDEYVSQRGGSCNAQTDAESTIFYFEVQQQSFKKSLDKFANFFCAPLLRHDCVDRELEAVHSEFELSKSNDSSRLEHLICSIARPESPYRRFFIGNKISLREHPDKAGTDIYKLLKQFQQQFYHASLMTLAVESKDTLDNIEELVVSIFKGMPSRNFKPNDLSMYAEPFAIEQFNKIYKVIPIKETMFINFFWSLPPMLQFYKSDPLGLLATVLGHEGEGSIIAVLRERNLALDVSAGTSCSDFHLNSLISIFEIRIQLSELGKKSYLTIASLLFSYLKMLREAAVQSLEAPEATASRLGAQTLASFISEEQHRRAVKFRFEEPQDAISTVFTVSRCLLLYPPAEVYSAERLLCSPDLKLYAELLNHMTPDTVNIAVVIPETATSPVVTPAPDERTDFLTEPWYDIRYKIEDISKDTNEEWLNPPTVPEFHIPDVNIFLASNFQLLPSFDDNLVPVDLNLLSGREKFQPYGHLWHQQSTKFKSPTAIVNVLIFPSGEITPRKNAFFELLVMALNQRIITPAYSAMESNLEFEIRLTKNGLMFQLSGFNEKMFELFRLMVKTLSSHPIEDKSGLMLTHERFNLFKERTRLDAYNAVMNSSVFNKHLRHYLLRKESVLVMDWVKELEHLQLSDFCSHLSEFLGEISVTAFVYGNLSKQDAFGFFDHLIKTLEPRPASIIKEFPPLSLPPGVSRVCVRSLNRVDVNTSTAFICPLRGTPSKDYRPEALNHLMACLLSEPAFNYFRTLETLGYCVQLCDWRNTSDSRQVGIVIFVGSQANKFNISEVVRRVLIFWYRIVPNIIFRLKSEAFKTIVTSTIASHQLEDTTMGVEFSRNWNQILSGVPMFDFRQRVIEILQTLKKEEFIEFYASNYCDYEHQQSALILVDAPSDEVSWTGDLLAPSTNPFDRQLVCLPASKAGIAREVTEVYSANVDLQVASCGLSLIEDHFTPASPIPCPAGDVKMNVICDFRLFKGQAHL